MNDVAGIERTTRHEVRVRFGETDLMGVVHHASFLSYFEAARIEYLRRRGMSYREWAENGLHLPVVELGVRYRKPARFDELLTIETRLVELSRVKARFEFRVLRARENTEEELAQANVLLACVDDSGTVKRIPDAARARLLGPETTAGKPC